MDIMLMVTALRCRTTSSNFQTDFADFEAAHLGELNGAANDMKRGMLAEFGPRGVDRALDRISTAMANQYGQGHPWLDCAELKSITHSLAMMRGQDALEEAADQLLSSDGRGEQLAWARR
ncbi:MAG: S-adenosyl-L-homocysteine hydrolase [Novosphingobium sp.]